MFEPMRFSGHVENNVVIPDEGVILPEGKEAMIEILGSGTPSTKKEHAAQLMALKKLRDYFHSLDLPKDFVFDRDQANDRDGIY